MSKKSKKYTARPCWPHPLLEIKPGMPPVIGSACAKPVVDDCDIYIGFDSGMTFTDRQFPWTPGVEIYYPIRDMDVPKNLKTYVNLINWTLEQLEGGAKVHAGCIGGHGRTGMFFAALVTVATGRKDAIAYVRKEYCKKACETAEQIDFLVKHFGVDSVKETKFVSKSGNGAWTQGGDSVFGDTTWTMSDATASGKAIVPLVSSKTIWGDALYIDEEDL